MDFIKNFIKDRTCSTKGSFGSKAALSGRPEPLLRGNCEAERGLPEGLDEGDLLLASGPKTRPRRDSVFQTGLLLFPNPRIGKGRYRRGRWDRRITLNLVSGSLPNKDAGDTSGWLLYG